MAYGFPPYRDSGSPGARNCVGALGSVVAQPHINKAITPPMKSSTQDKAEGTGNQLKGKIKEHAGKAVGDPNLRDEGRADQAAGKVQKKVGDVKKVFDK